MFCVFVDHHIYFSMLMTLINDTVLMSFIITLWYTSDNGFTYQANEPLRITQQNRPITLLV